MFEGPAMIVWWLMTPALVGFASLGAGLAFDAVPKLWAAHDEGNAFEKTPEQLN